MKSNHPACVLASVFALFIVAPSPRAMSQEFANHTYLAVQGNFTWHQAKADAESRGGHLATITSQDEFDYVLGLGILPSSPYWLGATDEVNEGAWLWVTGEPWSFTMWSSGEPNNTTVGGEHYLSSALSIGHRWNDGNEATPISFYLLEIDFCTPHKAQASAQLVNSFVVDAIITNPGCGYTNAPMVLIEGGGGNGATATATILNGQVTAINITDAGCCYTNVPHIVIGSPPFVPTVGIKVKTVEVSQHVVLGWNYLLEGSTNMIDWTPTGPQFTATNETIVTEFDVGITGQYFRIRQVP